MSDNSSMSGTTKTGQPLDTATKAAIISESSSRILDMMNEVKATVRRATLDDLSLQISEEIYRIVAARFLATNRDLTMLLRYKDVLLGRLEEENKMLKHLNQKHEYEYEIRVGDVEKKNTKLKQEILDVRCELVTVQKRLNFALARPPTNMPSSVVEASKLRSLDRYKTAVHEIEKHEQINMMPLSLNRTTESYNEQSRLKKDSDKNQDASEKLSNNAFSRREDCTPLTKEQVTYLKSSRSKQLPSLLTKERFPNLPNINISLSREQINLDKRRKNESKENSQVVSRQNTRDHNKNKYYKSRAREDSPPTKADQSRSPKNKHGRSDGETSPIEISSVFGTAHINTSGSDLRNSQKLKRLLPSHANNFQIDYHKFGVISYRPMTEIDL